MLFDTVKPAQSLTGILPLRMSFAIERRFVCFERQITLSIGILLPSLHSARIVIILIFRTRSNRYVIITVP